MGFKQLITKVTQAEHALEAQERRLAADWRQLKASWNAAWTPGRIVIAGLVSGFVIGRAEPLRAAARSGQIMQLVTMLSGLFAGGTAKVAADEAGEAKEKAEDVAEAVAPETLQPGAIPPGTIPPGTIPPGTTSPASPVAPVPDAVQSGRPSQSERAES